MVEERTIGVAGMTCTGCEESIQKALGRLDGVEDARADHEQGEVAVRYDSGRVTDADIEERIRAAGYDVT